MCSYCMQSTVGMLQSSGTALTDSVCRLVLETIFPFMSADLEGESLPPLTAFSADFQEFVNLDTLVPHLCQKKILLPTDIYTLGYHTHTLSRSKEITSLLSLLSRKGKRGIDGLILSLQADKEEIGHNDLAGILKKVYCKYIQRYHGACIVIHESTIMI